MTEEAEQKPDTVINLTNKAESKVFTFPAGDEAAQRLALREKLAQFPKSTLTEVISKIDEETRRSVFGQWFGFDLVAVLLVCALVSGGVVAYYVKDSFPSLVSSLTFGLMLIFGIVIDGVWKKPTILLGVEFGLLSTMIIRFISNWSIWSGLYVILTVCVLTQLIYRIRYVELRKKAMELVKEDLLQEDSAN